MRKSTSHQRLNPSNTLSLIALAVATAFPVQTAFAQAAKPAGDEASQLETVIVTGQRRSENLKEDRKSVV